MKLKELTKEQRICKNEKCNNEFTPIRSNGNFCSDKCMTRHNANEYYKNNKQSEKKKRCERYLKNREEAIKYTSIWQKNNKDKVNSSISKRYKTNKLFNMKVKKRAKHRYILRRDFKDHECKKCKIIFAINKLDIHHPDWETPEEFDILCIKCHKEIHRVK